MLRHSHTPRINTYALRDLPVSEKVLNNDDGKMFPHINRYTPETS